MNNLENNQPSPYLIEANLIRTILMIEIAGPQSNKYAQILLSQDQYSKIMHILGTVVDKGPFGQPMLMTGKELIKLPEHLCEYYEQDRILKLL